MSETTGISWTRHTFNPWWGCTKVSPACQHCYAERDSKRFGFKVWGANAERRRFGDAHWKEPVRWNREAREAGEYRRVFCASMADVFEDHPDVEAERERLWELIDQTQNLTWLLLTKRPENIGSMIPWVDDDVAPANVWLGTTVEDQEYADKRLPKLLSVFAAVHFVSYEPALGSVDWRPFLPDPLDGMAHAGGKDLYPIDWLIAGGESGPGNREPDIEWFRQARNQCARVGVPFHFKQWGGSNPKANGRMLDGREWLDVQDRS